MNLAFRPGSYRAPTRRWGARATYQSPRRTQKNRRERYAAPELEVLESRIALTPFTMTSPTAAGPLPAPVTPVGGIVLDLVGLNGVRVVSQAPASSLFNGYFDTGLPASYRGNPGTIGTQDGFSPTILQALGGGLSEIAVRVTLLDGDTAGRDFDFADNQLLMNSVPLGDFSDVITQETGPDGQTGLAPLARGFPDVRLATGFFHSADPQVLNEIFAGLAQSGRMIIQLRDLDPFDNHFDFTVGIDGNLIDAGRPPQTDHPPDAKPPPEAPPGPSPSLNAPQSAALAIFLNASPTPPVQGPVVRSLTGNGPPATSPGAPSGGALGNPFLPGAFSTTMPVASESLAETSQPIPRSQPPVSGPALLRARQWLTQALADAGEAFVRAGVWLGSTMGQGARDLLAMANRPGPAPVSPAPTPAATTQASNPPPIQGGPLGRTTASQAVLLVIVAMTLLRGQGRARSAVARFRSRRLRGATSQPRGPSTSATRPSSTP